MLLQSNWNYLFVNFFVTLLSGFFRVNIFFSYILFVYCIFLIGLTLYLCLRSGLTFRFTSHDVFNFLLTGTIFRTLSMLSSSYIEFEQYIWYFLWSSVTIFGAYVDFTARKSWDKSALWVGLAAGLRLARNLGFTQNLFVFIAGN